MSKSKVLKTASEVTNDRWVFIVPEQDASRVENDDHFVTLPHPKTGHRLQYLLKGNGTELFEVVKFSEQPRSWFIDNHVLQDGCVYVVTRFDPLFMVLPFLKNSSSKFMTLDHILQDSDHQFIGKISKCITRDDLRLLCDVKGEDDLVVCKLNDDKVIAWLKTKVEQTKDCLQNVSIISASGSQASTFIRSSKNARDCTQGDYLRYALGLLSDYISDYWSQKIRVALGIVNELMESSGSSGEEPASKKVKLENDVVGKPNEDYSNYFAKNKKSDQNSNVKLSAAQKSLMKVNKKGMKSISSFFGTTTKTSGKSK